MVDITHKITTQRTATAQAIVKVGDPATIQAIRDKNVPKGDVLEVARTAGLFAVKNTSNAIPDCHPLPIEFTEIKYEILEMEIYIEITVKIHLSPINLTPKNLTSFASIGTFITAQALKMITMFVTLAPFFNSILLIGKAA